MQEHDYYSYEPYKDAESIVSYPHTLWAETHTHTPIQQKKKKANDLYAASNVSHISWQRKTKMKEKKIIPSTKN